MFQKKSICYVGPSNMSVGLLKGADLSAKIAFRVQVFGEFGGLRNDFFDGDRRICQEMASRMSYRTPKWSFFFMVNSHNGQGANWSSTSSNPDLKTQNESHA